MTACSLNHCLENGDHYNLLVRPGAACRIDNKDALARLSVFFTLPVTIWIVISVGSVEVVDC